MSSEVFGAATQIFSHKFDTRLAALPSDVQQRIQDKIDRMGVRLRDFQHFRMQGATTFRLRVGDYRIIYEFDVDTNEIFLIALGHRRDIYKR